MSIKRKERIASIYTYLKQHGYANIPNLMRVFQVSKSTIIRDLDEIAEMKMAERIHGGIILTDSSKAFPKYSIRENLNKDAKVRIAQAAAKLIEDDDSILLFSGTTCFDLYKEIHAKNVTVFTLNIASLFYENPNVSHLFILEGEVSPGYAIVGGNLTIENFNRISPSKIFFSVSAINENFELQCRTDVEYAMIRAILKMKASKILLADKTKTSQRRSFNVTSLDKVDVFITDTQIDPDIAQSIEEKGTHLVVV